MMSEDHLKDRLRRSPFRSRFRLGPGDQEYARRQGPERIKSHALDFVTERLAPASPLRDGKQTPMKGHPVFLAQHATATCCRKCLQKWHALPLGRDLSQHEINYVARVIMDWIEGELKGNWIPEKEDSNREGRQLSLFEIED